MPIKTSLRSRARHAHYWHRVKRLTAILLAIWFSVTMIVIFFARELSTFSLFGWPFSFYMAAQGSILIYVVIVGVYAWRMNLLDSRHAKRRQDGR